MTRNLKGYLTYYSINKYGTFFFRSPEKSIKIHWEKMRGVDICLEVLR